ncbi:MAG: checkpoint serine threonine- kinase BUB1-like, partial [Trebouxia sp. A1-2]
MRTNSAVQQVAVSSPKQVAASSPTLNTLRLPDMTSNVTMATKDAFACVNAMFSSSLCHEPSRPSRPMAMAEPTVTISTQAAFAELNQMFSSNLPHHKQRAGPEQQMLQRPAPKRAIGKRPAPQAAVAPQMDLGTGASGGPNKLAMHKGSGVLQADVTGLGLYEDTCFLDSPRPAAGSGDAAADNETHGLAVYEDTNFFVVQPAVEGNACNAENPISSHQGMQHVSGNDAVGFQMYEDTQCLAQKPGLPVESVDDDMGFGIYEDTQFANEAKQEQKAASVLQLPVGFGIREDTQFVGGAKADFARLDTQDDHACSPAGFGIYEDTQFFDKENCDGARLMSQAAAVNNLEQAEDKENQHGPVKSFARDISDPAAEAAALQPLTGRRAAQLGLTHMATDSLHANMPVAKTKLAEVASSTVGDHFNIFRDEKQHVVPTPRQRLATQVQGLDAAMQHMSPFRQRPQSIQPVHAVATVDQHVIDPFDASLHSSLLAGLDPPLEQWKDVLLVDGNPSEFDKLKQVRRQNVKPISLQLGSHTMMVQQKLGQGAFASVYQVQSPPCPWEFYICKVLQGRVAPGSLSLFLSADMLYLLPKHSVMLTPYGRRGTLQDMLNAYLRKGKAAHIIHTDIKPDNLLLREAASSGLPAWHPSKPGLWSKTGLCLIDYGRAVDTALLPSNTKFKGDSQTEAFRCIEMQEGRAWGWGVDAFGVCSTIHCLLFGEYMQVEKTISPE